MIRFFLPLFSVLLLISCTQTKDTEAVKAQALCDCQKFVHDYDSVAQWLIHPQLSDSVNFSTLQHFYELNQSELDSCAVLVDQKFESRLEIMEYFRSADLECD